MPAIGFTLNGERVDVGVAGGSALDLIRGRLGLTGAKNTCGTGGCGACVVLVDGTPTETCIAGPEELSDKTVVTIEGLGTNAELTALQREMVAHDAIQCGFCTPGLVLAGEAFLTSWREKHGNETPDRATVARALDGHLCRCGAYPGIIEAVQAAASGEVDFTSGSIRPDAPAKASGSAKFTVDMELDGQLEGRIIRSTRPRAEVKSIDWSPALTMPGIRGFVDLLGKDRQVRYVGQPIAAVAGTDLETARAAADAVVVEYEDLPSAIGMEAARADDAPNLIGSRLFMTSNYEAGMFAATLPRSGNMRGPMNLLSKRRFTAKRRIEAARGLRDPLLVDDVWRAASQAHAAPEPHAAVAHWENGALTLYLSTQSIYATASKMAKHLGIDRSKVKVVAEHVGGAYGGKQGLPDPSVAAAELARVSGAPVRIVFDAAEELAFGGYRPGAEIELAVLVDGDGTLQAIVSNGYMDSGDSAGQTVVGLMRISYPGPPMSLNDYDVISNGAPARPFQAPGSPIALFALEQAVDELASRLGTDPITLRRGWDPRPARRNLYDWVEGHPLWHSRNDPEPEGKRRGVGVAFGSWHYLYDPGTVVKVACGTDGLTVSTGVQDIGTGSATTLVEAVARKFGVDPSQVQVEIGNSSFGHGPVSSGSRTTPSIYPTAQKAAEELRSQLLEVLQSELGMEGAEPSDGGVHHAGEFVPWIDLWPRLGSRSVTAKRPRDGRLPTTPIAVEGAQFGWGVSDAAHIVEVEVDASTGDVRATRAAVALAAGTIHTPSQARSQVHGALARGIGEALYEERLTDTETGEVSTASYARYRMMRMSEMPEVEVEFLEDGFDHAPGGGVGIAELAITSIPGAVANAIAGATGWRPKKMPITPEMVRAALAYE